MVFSSLIFLCFFFPAVWLIYSVLPVRFQNGWLLVASLVFYAWGEPKYIVIMLFSTIFDYANGRLLAHFEGRKTVRKYILIQSLVVNLGLLAFFKYFKLAPTMPIGISFYTFQTLSYTIDVYRGRVKAQRNIINFGMYVCLFPQLIAGPIVRYSDIETQIVDRKADVAQIWQGLCRFIIGLGKKVILANQIGALWTQISASAVSASGVAGGAGSGLACSVAWLGAIAFMFQIYFDFSGYSDMAIGLGKMFGFEFPENFRYPYTAMSITDFWRRWHMTLSSWFREYLYIPLGGNRCGSKRQIFNLLIVWGLTGLWHGANWNFVLWGLYYFVFLVIEKMWLSGWLEKWPSWIRHSYTLLIVLFGWVIFACEDATGMGNYIEAMLGVHGNNAGQMFYYMKNYGALFMILIIGATRVPVRVKEWLFEKVIRNEKLQMVLAGAYIGVVLAVCFVFLVGDSYNPFLYFRF